MRHPHENKFIMLKVVCKEVLQLFMNFDGRGHLIQVVVPPQNFPMLRITIFINFEASGY